MGPILTAVRAAGSLGLQRAAGSAEGSRLTHKDMQTWGKRSHLLCDADAPRGKSTLMLYQHDEEECCAIFGHESFGIMPVVGFTKVHLLKYCTEVQFWGIEYFNDMLLYCFTSLQANIVLFLFHYIYLIVYVTFYFTDSDFLTQIKSDLQDRLYC